MTQSQYLGSNMQASGDIQNEIMSQIGKAAAAFIYFKKIQSLKIYNLKNRLNIQFMLFSTEQMDGKAGNLPEIQALI